MIFGRRLVQNGWVWAAAAVSLALQLLVVYVPAVARPFGTVVPTPHSLAVVAVASALPLLVAQLAKALHRRRRTDRSRAGACRHCKPLRWRGPATAPLLAS